MTRRPNLVALAALAGLLTTGIIAAQNATTPVPLPESTIAPAATPLPEFTLAPEATLELNTENATYVEAGGISLLIPTGIAEDTTVDQIEATALDLTVPPAGQFPANTVITLDGYLTDENDSPAAFFGEPAQIRIFNTDDFTAYDPTDSTGINAEFAALTAILSERGELFDLPALPLVPRIAPPQTFFAREKYIDFDGGSGVLYLASFGFDVRQIVDGDVAVIFQGLSTDGKTYISAVLPIKTNYLPAEVSASFDDSAYEDYLSSIRAGLNEWAAAQFTPDLSVIEAMFASIQIVR